jgi:Ser/Thr protein kinase RdoA (MazF antagonist)
MEPCFPANYSTLSSFALASAIAANFGFGEVECQFLVRGVGHTYLIKTTDNRYILRVYRQSHRSLPQVKTEATFLQVLKEASVSVSYSVTDLSGKVIWTIRAVEGLLFIWGFILRMISSIKMFSLHS